ncbi:hypothetical protein LNA01_07320 [Companilactobacillus nantensis]|nr:hypothetical protein LNA01_07320 [Companilactobacillus nantensis]
MARTSLTADSIVVLPEAANKKPFVLLRKYVTLNINILINRHIETIIGIDIF